MILTVHVKTKSVPVSGVLVSSSSHASTEVCYCTLRGNGETELLTDVR